MDYGIEGERDADRASPIGPLMTLLDWAMMATIVTELHERATMTSSAYLLALPLLLAGCTQSASPVAPRDAPTAPSAPRILLGRILYPVAQVRALQREAMQGKGAGPRYLNPTGAVGMSLPERGFVSAQIYPPLRVPFWARGHHYTALMTQPSLSGSSGIWVIYAVVGPTVRVVRLHMNSHRLQRRVDAGDQGAAVYTDPIAALRRELPGLGIRGPLRVASRLTILVRQGLASYDVMVTQPEVTGPHGAKIF